MKKLYALTALIFVLFSCSETDGFDQNENAAKQPIKIINAPDPTKLAKVIFFPGTNSELCHYFYPNGLVKKMTRANGTTIHDFTYNANSDLVLSHTYQNNEVYTTTFTYDNAHHLTSMNGNPVTYDAANNRYHDTYTPTPFPKNDPECPGCYDDLIARTVTLSAEFLAQDEYYTYQSFDGTGTFDYYHHGLHAGYSANNNLMYSGNWVDPSWSHYNHDNKTNPLKAAFLPVCRAYAATGGGSFGWNAHYSSANNVIANVYESSDPERDEFIPEFNTNNLPIKSTLKSYYFDVLESTRVFALYYYQGDVIP